MLLFADLIRLSTRQVVRRNRRSLGTFLAITLGTVGFIVIITMGRDVKMNLNKDLDILGGATMIKVYFDQNYSPRTEFRPETVDALRQLPGVTCVSLLVQKLLHAETPLKDTSVSFPVVGVDDFFWEANSLVAFKGRLFLPDDHREHLRVCVLGASLAGRVYGDADPIGRYIKIDRDFYLVVGIVGGPGLGDRTRFAFLPFATTLDRVERLMPRDRLYVRCATWDDVDAVASVIPGTIARHQETQRLVVDVAREQIRHIRRIEWWVHLFIYISVLATLLLGGFGIWNGMMSAVRARTREIGLKKAMGAEDRDILKQFLAEALAMSLAAALTGIVVSRLAIEVIARLLQSPPQEGMFLLCVALSIIFSVVLGMGAGFYPALRASRMDVVTAVRYE